MGTPKVVDKVGDADFKWGRRIGVAANDKELKCYESFLYDGVEYNLYDCVYVQNKDDEEPYIGKLVNIMEKPNKSKMVKVHWFFRPSEIVYWLRQSNQRVLRNELILASGEGVGLADINPVEAIVGKCNIVCISKDTRNPQPSREQLQIADYVFHRTFDVGNCVFLEDFGDKVGSLEVKFVFNQKDNEKYNALKEKAASDLGGENVQHNATNASKLPYALDVLNQKSKRRLENKVEIVVALMSSSFPGKNNVAMDVVKDNEPLKGRAEFGKIPLNSMENLSIPSKRTKHNGSFADVDIKDLAKDEKSIAARDILKTSTQGGVGVERQKQIGEILEPMEPKKETELVKPSSTLNDGTLKKVKLDKCSPNTKLNPNHVENTSELGGLSKNSNEHLLQGSNLSCKEDMHDEKKKATGGYPRSLNPNHVEIIIELGGLLKNSNEHLPQGSNLSCKEDMHDEKKKATDSYPRSEVKRFLVRPIKDKSSEKKDMPCDSFGSKTAICEGIPRKMKSALPKDAITEGMVIEVTQRPADDEGKWFDLPPWEERIIAANDRRMLVLLQNLDPHCTSSEVQDLIWHAFREKCSAKVVQRSAFSSRHSGQALVIFKTREAAAEAVRKLNDGCLMLPNLRPLVGRIADLPKTLGKQPRFVGNLVIDKVKLQSKRDKDAKSTSHCSQPNTIEHELAMEWCLLTSRSDLWWKELHKHQRAELKQLMNGVKSN